MSQEFRKTAFAMRGGLEKALYPSIDLSVMQGGKLLYRHQLGCKDDGIFDLASLTKPLVAGFILLQAISEKKINIDDPAERYLSFLPHQLQKIKIVNLMSHCSGLSAHHDWYKEISDEFGGPENLLEAPSSKRVLWYQKKFQTEAFEYSPGTKTVYSDLGYWLLGWIIEKIYEAPLDEVAAKKIFYPLGLAETFFIRTEKLRLPSEKIERILPTENCPWRGELQGEVHDDNCWAMGGVSGHAGLFSSMKDLLKISKAIHEKKPLIKAGISEGILSWSERRLPEPTNSTRTPVWDTPSEEHSSVGKLWSPRSFGWMGFTGTSFWTDPDRKLTAIILTNRVHPSREERGYKKYRSLLHTAVMEDLG